MEEYEQGKQKPRNIKEMRLRLQKMKEEAQQRKLQENGKLF